MFFNETIFSLSFILLFNRLYIKTKAQNRGQGGLRPVAGALSDRPRGQRAGPHRAHPLPAGPVVSCAVLRLGAAFLLQPQAGGGGFAALLLRAGAGRLPPSALRNREVCVLPWSFPWA